MISYCYYFTVLLFVVPILLQLFSMLFIHRIFIWPVKIQSEDLQIIFVNLTLTSYLCFRLTVRFPCDASMVPCERYGPALSLTSLKYSYHRQTRFSSDIRLVPSLIEKPVNRILAVLQQLSDTPLLALPEDALVLRPHANGQSITDQRFQKPDNNWSSRTGNLRTIGKRRRATVET